MRECSERHYNTEFMLGKVNNITRGVRASTRENFSLVPFQRNYSSNIRHVKLGQKTYSPQKYRTEPAVPAHTKTKLLFVLWRVIR